MADPDTQWTDRSAAEIVQTWTTLSDEQKAVAWRATTEADRAALREALSRKEIRHVEKLASRTGGTAPGPHRPLLSRLQSSLASLAGWLYEYTTPTGERADDTVRQIHIAIAIGTVSAYLTAYDSFAITSRPLNTIAATVTLTAIVYVLSVLHTVARGNPDQGLSTRVSHLAEAVFRMAITVGVVLYVAVLALQ
jgi:hypothetical protein